MGNMITANYDADSNQTFDPIRDTGTTTAELNHLSAELAEAGKSGIVSNLIGYKPLRAVNYNSAAGKTFFVKLAVPVLDYTAVQLVVHHSDTTGSGNVVYQACVAATETADYSDAATTGLKTYIPTVGGAQYSALDSTASAYGWRLAKWAGLTTLQSASATSNDNPNVYVSDVIPVTSVPRADAGEIFPIVMIRLNTVSGATGTMDYVVTSNRTVTGVAGVSGTYVLSVTPGSGGSFLSCNVGDYVSGTNIGTNAKVVSIDSASQITVDVQNSGTVSAATMTITSPIAKAIGGTNQPNAAVSTTQNGGLLMQSYFITDASGVYVTAPATNNPVAGINTTFPNIGIILHSSIKGPTLCWFGDSTVHGNNISYGGAESAGLKVAARIASLGTPCGWINQGRSNGTTAQYMESAAKVLAAWKPSIAIMQVWSHNNNTSVPFNSVGAVNYWAGQLKATLGTIHNICSPYNIFPAVSTGTPATSIATSTIDTARVSFLDSFRVSNISTLCFDTSSAVTDGNSPERIAAKYNYGDSVHICNAGLDAQANEIVKVIRLACGI